VTPSISITRTPSVTPSISVTPPISVTPSIAVTRTPSVSVTPSISITGTPSVTRTPTKSPPALYTVTVRRGTSATRTIGFVGTVSYKLGAGGTKTTLASGITGPTCNTTGLVGTVSNVSAGTVFFVGFESGTTQLQFGAAGCAGSSTSNCGFSGSGSSNPYQVTVNSNITIELKLNVSGGAFTTC
jgi:hypothetical protein